MTKRKLTLRCLCEGAIMLALAQVLLKTSRAIKNCWNYCVAIPTDGTPKIPVTAL